VRYPFNPSKESDEHPTRSERTWQESQRVLEVLSIRFPSVALQGKAAFHAVPSEREGDSALTVCRGRGKRNAFMGYVRVQ
jgi:hypothetical protein